MCRHPLDPTKRVNCTPTRVVELLECVWDGRPTMDPPVFFIFRFFFHRESYCGLPGVCFWGFGFELGRLTMEFPVFVLGLSV